MTEIVKMPATAAIAALLLALGTFAAEAGSTSDGDVANSDRVEQRAPGGTDSPAGTTDVEAGGGAAGAGAGAPAAHAAPADADTAATTEASATGSGAAPDDAIPDDGPTDQEAARKSLANSKSVTKSIDTPHMAMSITHSMGFARDGDGDLARARAMAKAQALDTPGQVRTDTRTKTSVAVAGDAEAAATAEADAEVGEAGPSATTFGETSVAVH